MVQVPVFYGLEPHQWARVLPVFKFIEFQAGETVYKHGTSPRAERIPDQYQRWYSNTSLTFTL